MHVRLIVCLTEGEEFNTICHTCGSSRWKPILPLVEIQHRRIDYRKCVCFYVYVAMKKSYLKSQYDNLQAKFESTNSEDERTKREWGLPRVNSWVIRERMRPMFRSSMLCGRLNFLNEGLTTNVSNFS